MRTLALLATCAALPSFAQFSSMSTDFAGERLFFTTELSQAGSGQPDYGKVFVANSGSVRPQLIYGYVSTRADPTSLLFPYGLLTNFYYVDGVDLSSNGAYLSVMALRACSGYTSGLCGYPDQTIIYDNRGQAALTTDGHVILSPNGKWALGVAKPLWSPFNEFKLFDLTNGKPYSVLSSDSEASFMNWRDAGIADDGTAVVPAAGEGLLLLRAGSSKTTFVRAGGDSAAINAAGSVIVWQDVFALLYAARTTDPSSKVLLANALPGSRPHLSDDGNRVMFLSAPNTAKIPQAFTITSSGTGCRQVTSEPDGIADAVLSGSGRIVWAVTRAGRLLQIDTDTGRRVQYTDPLAAFLQPPYLPDAPFPPTVQSAPGDMLTLPASVMPGEKIAITMNGQAVPILRVEPRNVVVQIPWAAPDDQFRAELAITKPDFPSWSGNKMPVGIRPANAKILSAAHQNFSGVIDVQQPAAPGEIIHLYGTGFGIVNPLIPDGAPAPLYPLSRTVTPVGCTLSDSRGQIVGPAEVFYAGLAPGFTGIYQIDLRLPERLPAGPDVTVSCAPIGAFAVSGILIPLGH